MDDGQHASRGLAGRHWRGELGLNRSLWKPVAVFSGFVAVFLIVLLYGRAVLPPLPAFVLTVCAWTMLLAMIWWLCAGVFRSGMAHGSKGGESRNGYLVAAAMALILLAATVWAINLARVDLFRSMMRIQDYLPSAFTVTPSDDGTEIVLAGYIDHGAADTLERAVRNLPDVTLIRLNSIGGELEESRRVRDFIARKRWDTHASENCWSGCAIAFLGGVHRSMGPQAKMGFHSVNIWPSGDDETENRINASIAQEMIDRGVDAAFARKAWSKAYSGMWYPLSGELVRARLVHVVSER